ncbi:unnamed protein product [Heterobilharzia americana]|nr:unnamed protein product [Heterobilharzia americana]
MLPYTTTFNLSIVKSLLLLLLLLCGEIHADTPANCTYNDAVGHWVFHLGDYHKKCYSKFKIKTAVVMHLQYPDIVTDSYGNTGKWTMIYNQGFEITIRHRKFLVMFAYGSKKSYNCSKSMPMLTHDTLIHQWYCFTAMKIDALESTETYTPPIPEFDENSLYKVDPAFVDEINAQQGSWRAKIYPKYSTYTMKEMRRLAGGSMSVFKRPSEHFLFLCQ